MADLPPSTPPSTPPSRPPIEPPPPKVGALPRPLKILFMLFGAVMVFAIVFGATRGAILLRNPRIRAKVMAIRDGIGTFVQGWQAPGADALRKAGCDFAAVMDLGQFLGRSSDGSGPPASVPPFLEHPVVTCTILKADASFTCEHVAQVYGNAVADAPDSFPVLLTVQGQKEPVCSGLYARDGRRTGDFGPPRHD
jgi:hypothetical protein